MNKQVIMTVSPLEALNVLNGKASMLIRKRVPKGYVGWVWLVVSRKLSGRMVFKKGEDFYGDKLEKNYICKIPTFFEHEYGGRVIAKYWHDEVVSFFLDFNVNKYFWYDKTFNRKELSEALEKLCLTEKQFNDYADNLDVLPALNLNKLEILDTPLELGEFYRDWDRMDTDGYGRYVGMSDIGLFPLTKAPSTYQYVYTKEK